MMQRAMVMTLLAGALFTSLLLAKPGVVKLNDGQSIDGDIIREEADTVTVSIRGIETDIPRDRIESITYYENRKADFQTRLEALDANDADGRIALARWAFENRLYSESRDLLEQVLANVDPNSREATDLLNLVRRQIAMERRTEAREQTERDAQQTVPTNGEDADPGQTLRSSMLTPEQIQRIKLAEIVEQDTRVRVSMTQDTRNQIAQAAGINSRQFSNLSAPRQIEAIRRFGNEQMLDEIELRGDPESMFVYRQRVQPLVLAGCAGAGCHNAPGAGDFVLFPRADNSEAASYTNFLILQRYLKTIETGGNGGPFGAENVQLRMINRARPQESLLIQYMLPPAMAQYPHPETRGYSGVVRGPNDQRITQVGLWIQSLAPFEPNYGIDYTPPGTPAATQPAEQVPDLEG